MSVFNPECTSNYFHVQDIDPSECAGGNPYDMGDLQAMKGAINKAMTHARRARREWEGAQQ